MKTKEQTKDLNPTWKTMTCVLLSMFYFAMLAYPFGVSKDGYMLNQALIAGVIFFAISIPAWIINVKREFYKTEGAAQEESEPEVAYGSNAQARRHVSMNVDYKGSRIGELATQKKWLTPKEIKQILFCQRTDCGDLFGEIAVKRNYLSQDQVNNLLKLQPDLKTVTQQAH